MLAVSSLNNVIAQTAPAALTTHMEQVLEQAEEAVATSLRSALAVKPLLGTLTGEADSRCAQAEGERMDGSLSCSPGDGAVAGMLDVLCVQSRSVAMALANAVTAAESRSDEAADVLRRMDLEIRDHAHHVFEREARFLGLMNDLESWIRLSDADDLTRTIEIAHAAMAASLSPPALSGGSFGTRQMALIEGLRISVKDTGAVYRDVVARLQDDDPPRPLAKRISLVEAVWRSRVDHMPQIAAAIGIDFFQLFMVLAFLLARLDRAQERPVHDEKETSS